jgi:hypothetical protein
MIEKLLKLYDSWYVAVVVFERWCYGLLWPYTSLTFYWLWYDLYKNFDVRLKEYQSMLNEKTTYTIRYS